jgi:hypothetical protein
VPEGAGWPWGTAGMAGQDSGPMTCQMATRYGKLAITYRAAVVLSPCITWTRT